MSEHIDRFLERARAERAAHGLPVPITDRSVLARVAAIVRRGEARRAA